MLEKAFQQLLGRGRGMICVPHVTQHRHMALVQGVQDPCRQAAGKQQTCRKAEVSLVWAGP